MNSKDKNAISEERNEKSVLVPRLRFPEFRGAKEWANKLLGPYLEDCTGRVPPDTELPIYSSTREGLKRQDAYFNGRVLQNKNEYGVVPPGCLVYRHMSDDGLFKFNINQTSDDIAVSKEYPVFRTKGLNSVFLLAKLNDGLDFKQFALSQKAGGTRTRLYFSRLCEWRTLIPLPAEQEKIADCLSSLDELISAETQKLEALKTYKKGLMQLLFPREGEAVPQLRFPKFRKAGEWKERLFGDLLDDIIDFRGRTPTKLGMEWGGGNIPALSANNVKNGFIDYNAECYLASEELYSRWMGEVNLEKEDIVFTMEAPLGNALLLPDSRKYILSQRVVAFKTKADVLNPFLVQIIWGDGFQNEIGKLATGSTAKGINQKSLRTIPVRLPNTDEQKSIAECLSPLDDFITTQSQKINALKTHKKGLMQQLFPVQEEVQA